MNLMSIEVRIKSIEIATPSSHNIAFSLRLGTVLSSMSHCYPNHNDGPIQINSDLLITCEESYISTNTRACLVIYSIPKFTTKMNQNEKNIVGMIFIELKGKQGEIIKYKIQQSNDPHSYVEILFHMGPLELKQRQNSSQASRSSLAEVKEFHNVLSKDPHYQNKEKDSSQSSSYDHDGFQIVNRRDQNKRLSPQNKELSSKKKNRSHIKSEEGYCNQQNPDPSYAILLKRVQQQLAKEKQKTVSLVNLLAIEQQKNREADSFIKKLIGKISQRSHPPTKKTQMIEDIDKNDKVEQNQPKSLNSSRSKRNLHEDEKKQSKKNSISNKPYDEYNEALVKERDQLYEISQDLFEKTKLFKRENQQFKKNVRHLENQLQLYSQELEELKTQNIQLKKKVFQLCDHQVNSNLNKGNSQLEQKINELQNENNEKQRQIKESLKAIQEFRQDAWRAHEEVISKDTEIAQLKEEIDFLKEKIGSKNGIRSRNQSQISIFSQNQADNSKKNPQKAILNSFKKVISQTNCSREEEFDKIHNFHLQNQKFIAKCQELDPQVWFEKMKQKIEQLYQELKTKRIKSIEIIQMRQRLMKILVSAKNQL